MIEIAKEVLLWFMVIIGIAVTISRFLQLLLQAIVGEDGFDEYVNSKAYRNSPHIVIHCLGAISEVSFEFILNIIKAFPVMVGVFSSLVLLWVFYALHNT